MNLAAAILWLALRGLAVSALVLCLRLVAWVLRAVLRCIRHELTMRPQNVYFVA